MNKEEILADLSNWEESKLVKLYQNAKRPLCILETRQDIAIRKTYQDIRKHVIWRWSYEFGRYIESEDCIEVGEEFSADDGGDGGIDPTPINDKFLCQVYERKDSIFLHSSNGKIEREIILGASFPDCQCMFSQMSVAGDYIAFGFSEPCKHNPGATTKFPIYNYVRVDQDQKYIQVPPTEITRIQKLFNIVFNSHNQSLYDLQNRYFYIVMFSEYSDEDFHFLFDSQGNYMYNLEEFFQDRTELFHSHDLVDGCKISTTKENGYCVYEVFADRLKFKTFISDSDAKLHPFYTLNYNNGQVITIDSSMFCLFTYRERLKLKILKFLEQVTRILFTRHARNIYPIWANTWPP